MTFFILPDIFKVPVSELYSFLFPNSIPRFAGGTFLLVCSLMDIWVASAFWLSQITWLRSLEYKFLSVRGAFGDENSVLPKHLVIQGDRVLTCMSGGSLSLVPGSGCLVVCHAVGASCPPVPEPFWLLTSFLRVKALRKQAAGRPKVTGDEDPVMGTATWVSDVGVFSRSGGRAVHVH